MQGKPGLGPARGGAFGKTGVVAPPPGAAHAIGGPRLTDGVAGIDRAPHRVGDIGGAVEQLRKAVVGLCDGVAHARAAGYVDCSVVDENPHQWSVRWKRTSSGASTGARSTPR